MTEKSHFSDAAEKLALNVSLASFLMNLLLSVFKLFAGIAGHSQAMISDAVHSASDCASTVVVMIGVHCGHRQAECCLLLHSFRKFPQISDRIQLKIVYHRLKAFFIPVWVDFFVVSAHFL